MTCNTIDYLNILEKTLAKFDKHKDYITQLDAATGDGDHYINMHKGFAEVARARDTLLKLPFQKMLFQVGKIIMKSVGGSSGVLYGSGYMRAAQAVGDVEALTVETLLQAYESMLVAIQERGKTKPGEKTMVDTLYPFVESLKRGVASDKDECTVLHEALASAKNGMESTKDMVAVKGRATYQGNKGVGNLDPGAVTFYYHVEVLIHYLTEGA